jgi:zinc resistance-associated protein
MWKIAFVGTIVILAAGSMIVYAQQELEPAKAPTDKGEIVDTGIAEMLGELKPNAEDIVAFSEARMAALHAAIGLNADQEKLWPPLEEALHNLGKMRADRISTTREQQPFSNPAQQLRRQADALALRHSALIRFADTLEPLYQSFNDEQKRQFAKLARFIRPFPYVGVEQAELNGRNALDDNKRWQKYQ